MNRDWAIAGMVALMLHGLLLFGFRLESAAVALPMGDTTVDVNLVDAAPSSAPPAPAAAEQPPEPTPTPPAPTPPPPPEPEATPAPVPDNTPVAPAPPVPHEHPSHHAPAHPSHPAAPSANATGSEHGAPATAGLRGTSSNPVRPMFNPRPDYPPEADRLGQRGMVLLDVEVNAEGRVTGVSVKRSSGFPSLDDAAMRGIRRWTFEPARVAGLPIASRAEVPVKFGPPR